MDLFRLAGLGILCLELVQPAQSMGAGAEEALVAYYPFTGNAEDAGGLDQHGVVTGATLAPDRFGLEDTCYRFDGASDWAEVPQVAFTNSGDFTISFWERTTGQHRMHAVSLGTVQGANLDFDFNDAGGIWVYWNGGGGLAIQSGTTGEFADGQWHNIVLRRASGTVELYIDGDPRGSTAYAAPMGVSGPLRIGRGSSVSKWWTGEVDELRLYNCALGDTEVAAMAADRMIASFYEWELVQPNAAFPPLDGGGALVYDGKMWMLGGWAPGSRPSPYTMNEVWVSADGDAWAALGSAPWEPRHTAGYAVHDGKMWVVGGDANSGHYQNDVWNSTNGVQWNLVTDNVPWGNRVLHHTVAFAGKIWVMGGQKLPHFIQDGPTDEMLYDDVWCTTNGVDWTRVLEHAPWAPRGMIGGGAVLRDKIWLLGGGTYNTPQHPVRNFYNDVWCTADGVNWTCVREEAPWEPRQYHDVAAFDGCLWVLEGYHGRNLNDVWCSADGVAWFPVPGTPWPVRHAASVYAHGDGLWMVAGNLWNDVWKLTRGEGGPLPPVPELAIEEPAGAGSPVRLWFDGDPFRTYWLEHTTDLNGWSVRQISCAGSGSRTADLDPQGVGPEDYFRLALPHPYQAW